VFALSFLKGPLFAVLSGGALTALIALGYKYLKDMKEDRALKDSSLTSDIVGKTLEKEVDRAQKDWEAQGPASLPNKKPDS
jgi:hypothetical protein